MGLIGPSSLRRSMWHSSIMRNQAILLMLTICGCSSTAGNTADKPMEVSPDQETDPSTDSPTSSTPEDSEAETEASPDAAPLVLIPYAPGDDAILDKLGASLPAGWSLQRSENRLHVRREEPIWVTHENRISAPPSNRTEAEDQAAIKARGKKTTAEFVYRTEPHWSDDDFTRVDAENASLRQAMAALPGKHGIDHLLSRRAPVYVPKAPGDEGKIEAYEKDQAALEARVVAVPSCNTTRSSLFIESDTGRNSGTRQVYPASASQEAYAIEESIRALCGKVK